MQIDGDSTPTSTSKWSKKPMEVADGNSDTVTGNTNGSGIQSAAFGQERGTDMTVLFMNAYAAVRSASSAVAGRVKSERGASMVEYALLVGLIAVVCIGAVALLGTSISGLFTTADNNLAHVPAG
jgi:pilus assembly protein Flp/PilA